MPDLLFLIILFLLVVALIYAFMSRPERKEDFGIAELGVPRPNFVDYGKVFCGFSCPPTYSCVYSFSTGPHCVRSF